MLALKSISRDLDKTMKVDRGELTEGAEGAFVVCRVRPTKKARDVNGTELCSI